MATKYLRRQTFSSSWRRRSGAAATCRMVGVVADRIGRIHRAANAHAAYIDQDPVGLDPQRKRDLVLCMHTYNWPCQIPPEFCRWCCERLASPPPIAPASAQAAWNVPNALTIAAASTLALLSPVPTARLPPAKAAGLVVAEIQEIPASLDWEDEAINAGNTLAQLDRPNRLPSSHSRSGADTHPERNNGHLSSVSVSPSTATQAAQVAAERGACTPTLTTPSAAPPRAGWRSVSEQRSCSAQAYVSLMMRLKRRPRPHDRRRMKARITQAAIPHGRRTPRKNVPSADMPVTTASRVRRK